MNENNARVAKEKANENIKHEKYTQRKAHDFHHQTNYISNLNYLEHSQFDTK